MIHDVDLDKLERLQNAPNTPGNCADYLEFLVSNSGNLIAELRMARERIKELEEEEP